MLKSNTNMKLKKLKQKNKDKWPPNCLSLVEMTIIHKMIKLNLTLMKYESEKQKLISDYNFWIPTIQKI
jgi:hypothetical protein